MIYSAADLPLRPLRNPPCPSLRLKRRLYSLLFSYGGIIRSKLKVIEDEDLQFSDAPHRAIIANDYLATSIDGEGNLDRIGQAKAVRCADTRGLFCDGGSYRKCVEVGTVEKKLPIPLLKISSSRDNRLHQNFAQANDRGPTLPRPLD